MPAAQAQWIAGLDELFGGATRCVDDLHNAMTGEQARDIAAVFQTLSHPARLHLVALLRTAPEGQASAAELAMRAGWSRSTVHRHLRALTAAGLVHRSASGAQTCYRVDAARLESVLALLGALAAISR
ncbi:MAG TPA: metalloregulator ArsR/SmtB family transcription factor [Actinophytocola sp.]|uniref:ArsR/SmtB family transcription factor n=1 Tax=Actinophytocola sp. TaxID=1872138 RepID=UPI002DB63402|nr:metalloregulator ArsR/SmtB family transcription factor [Actinophytocola sp.]HEU5470642.1 metalloregulator ArsR/SmtB family transcription factor [Actinophytocola sp.]